MTSTEPLSVTPPPPTATHPKPSTPVKSKPPPPSNSLEHSVQNVVDSVVGEAVTQASLQSEKDRVQSLINNLVTRVHSDAAATDASTPKLQGVPMGDHRLRRIGNIPLTWTQTMDSLTLNIHVPHQVRKEHIRIHFDSNSIHIAIRSTASEQLYLDLNRTFVADIDVAGCMWGLEAASASRKLIVELEKAKVQWWARLFSTDDVAEYSIVTPNQMLVNGHAPQPNRDTATSETAQPAPSESDISPNANGVASNPPKLHQAHRQESSSLEQAVASVVDDIVQNATSAAEKQKSEPSSPPRTTRQRMLTRADIPKIVDQYRAAFKSGGPSSIESALQLATFYHHGIGIKQDDAEAARLYRYALENGALDASAAFQLGLIYNQGAPGLEPDPEEAVRWWKLSAGLGNPVSMFNLGVMYLNGSGCDLDPLLAQQWFERAHAMNPQLKPPQLSKAQFAERMATAAKLRRERLRRELPPEEKQRRKEQALQKVRYAAYGTLFVAGLSISALAMRHWWQNRL